jgi:hypothetical protein
LVEALETLMCKMVLLVVQEVAVVDFSNKGPMVEQAQQVKVTTVAGAVFLEVAVAVREQLALTETNLTITLEVTAEQV